MRFPLSPHPLQHLLFVDFFHDDYYDQCEVVLHWVLICISLIISDVEPVFMCLLAICMSSLKKCLFRFSINFFNNMVWFFDIELHQLFIYFGDYLMAIRTSETLCFRWGIFLLPGLPLSSLIRATNFHFLHIPRLSSGLSPFICLPSASWLSE